MIIGYHKYKDDYIFEIEVIQKIDDDDIINKEFATYHADIFKILSITNWKTGEQLKELDEYKINKILMRRKDNYLFHYNLSKDLAICNYFSNDEERYLYLKNKCGLYTDYHYNGQIYRTYFHNNGIEEGEYKEYTQSGTIKAKRFYMNGKKYGESMIYHNNGIIYILSYYVNNILEGVYEEYY